jgi:iron complex outermembrane receptor protein
MRPISRTLASSSAALLTLSIAAAAQAAAPAKAPAASASDNNPNEIIVTAQRRSQTLLSVPLSIQASTGQQLQNTGIRQISSLQFTTPGMFVQNGTGYTQVYIRGIGNNIFVGADPSVATFIDDVPRIYGSSVNNFFNVERVEVLKGAQGGLYGRNATGGVINVITKQPSTDKVEVDGRLSYGEKKTFHGAIYVNVPVTEKIALNLSAQRDSHTYYVHNIAGPNPLTAANFPNGSYLGTPAQTAAFFNGGVNPPKGLGNQNFWAIDGKMLFKPTEDLRITLDADYSKKHDSEGNQWFNPDNKASQAGAEELFGLFGIKADFSNLYPPIGKFQTTTSNPSAANLVDYGGSLKIDWDLPGFTLTNITAYRKQHSLYEQNFPHPVSLDVPIVNNHKHYLYEEIRAVSTGPGPFHWIAGFTYLDDHFHGATTNLLLPPLGAALGLNTFTESTDQVKNFSVYGQVGYDITEMLNLTVSGRYIHETNHALFLPTTTGLAAASPANTKAHKFLPSATLSYKLENGGTIYARYAQGFKSGGVNPVVPPTLFTSLGTTKGLIFAPEKVDTYEVGAKSRFYDNKVAITLDGFYNNYRNLQTTAVGIDPRLILAIINAGTARTYGVEGSMNIQVAPEFTVGGSAGYLNAKYKDFKGGNDGVINPFDFSHRVMLFSPRYQVDLHADLDQPITEQYNAVASVLASYTSKTTAALSTTPGVSDVKFPGYWLTNLRVGVKTNNDRYGVYLVVTNLFDQRFYTFGSASNFGDSQVWGDRRIISGEITVKF